MNFFFLVNPYRDAAYAYLKSLKAYPEIHVVPLWSDPTIYERWKFAIPESLSSHLFLEKDNFKLLLQKINDLHPCGFVALDDAGVDLADQLQSFFFPDYCNDVNMREVRSNKFSYLNYLTKIGLNDTYQFLIDRIEDLEFETPFVIKPVNGRGNEGVYFVDSEASLKTVLPELQDRRCMVQEFVDGIEYCVEICAHKGRYTCTTIMQYGRTYLVNGISPWRHDNDLVDPPLRETLANYSIQVLKALGVRIGVSWLQIKIKNNRPILIECNFRSQGNAHFDAIFNSTGHIFSDYVLRSHLEKDYQLPEKLISYKKNGEFKKMFINNYVQKKVEKLDLDFIRSLPSTLVAYDNPLITSGTAPVTINAFTHLGSAILQNCDSSQFQKDFDAIKKWEKGIAW